MKGQVLCLLFAAFVATSYGMVFNCVDPDSCDKCPPFPPNCVNIRKCGCCNICEDKLKEGDWCVMSIVMATLNQKTCGAGLMCDQETMKCAPKTTVMAKLFPEKVNRVISQRHVPEAVNCNGSVCFCAHEGRQLQGYNLLKQEQISQHSCNCAHTKETYRRKGLIGKMFFCNKQGGFEKTQCLGSSCYCVNEAGERLLGDSFHISEIENHSC